MLALDPSIRDKVLLPLLLFVVVFSLSRGYLFRLLMPKPEGGDGDEARQRGVVARSGRLRAHMGYITPGGAAMRRAWLADEPAGALRAECGPAAAANPMAAMDTMKVQVVNQGVFIGLFYAIQVRPLPRRRLGPASCATCRPARGRRPPSPPPLFFPPPERARRLPRRQDALCAD